MNSVVKMPMCYLVVNNLANVSIAVLDEYLHIRWVGHGSDLIDWPPRSPNLSVCDYSYGFLKEKVFSHNIVTVDELPKTIEEELLPEDTSDIFQQRF